VAGGERQSALCGLAGRAPFVRRLQAVIERVAHQVGQGVGNALDHCLVEFGVAADDVQRDILAQLGRGVAHDATEAREGLADGHHAQLQGSVADLLDQAADLRVGLDERALSALRGEQRRTGTGDDQFPDQVDDRVEPVRRDSDQALFLRLGGSARRRGRIARRRHRGRRRRVAVRGVRHARRVGRRRCRDGDLGVVAHERERRLDLPAPCARIELEVEGQVAGLRVQRVERRHRRQVAVLLGDRAHLGQEVEDRPRIQAVAKGVRPETHADRPAPGHRGPGWALRAGGGGGGGAALTAAVSR